MDNTLFDTDEPKMSITALAPWKGSNRMLGPEVGKLLAGCEWVGVVFAGGMAEVPHIKARTLLVNDLHLHVINCARVLTHPTRGAKLIRRLRRYEMFHPKTLALAQVHCQHIDPEQVDTEEELITWAEQYFIAAWMGRSGIAGTDGEFNGNLSVRWNAGGGDSAVRFHNAVRGLKAWRQTLRRCNFTTLDFRKFLAKCKDETKHGIYSDSPFPDGGEDYVHKFTLQDHRDLASLLSGFTDTRIVCRFYDHPLIRELYLEPRWKWHYLEGRKQSNEKAPEVLLVNQ